MATRRLTRGALAVLLAALLVAGPASAAGASPLVELVRRFVPAHADVDAAALALSRARAGDGDGSPAARRAARAFAAASEAQARRTEAVAAATPSERALRDALASASHRVAAELRGYAAGAIDGAELARRHAELRRATASRVAALVARLAAERGLDGSLDGRSLLRGMAPVLLLVLGVVAIGALTRRRRLRAPGSRAS